MTSTAPRVKFIKKLRALNCVQRWNYHPRCRFENVAEHSYWVAVFAHQFAQIMKIDDIALAQFMSVALYHDRLEAITGDLPQPVKRGRDWTDVEEAAEQELGHIYSGDFVLEGNQRIIKAADLMAAYVFAEEEVKMGNSNFIRIKNEIITALYKVAPKEIHEFLIGWGIHAQMGVPPLDEMSHLG